MAMAQMDHVSVVVDDLAAATAFYLELGLEVEGSAPISGPWVEQLNGIPGLRCEIVLMRAPDGSGKLELTKFHSPDSIGSDVTNARANALGLRSVMFEVEDVQTMVGQLQSHGGALVGEIVQYEDEYLLAYVSGPAGVLVSLAQPLR